MDEGQLTPAGSGRTFLPLFMPLCLDHLASVFENNKYDWCDFIIANLYLLRMRYYAEEHSSMESSSSQVHEDFYAGEAEVAILPDGRSSKQTTRDIGQTMDNIN